ncbi:homeobox-leucine zipper protein ANTHOCYANINLESS 2-like isoform X5 [Citrus sinensis]|uniref:homeobox-leucine zipper protein ANTHOCYANINLESS 2-like isoform X5 n=1 Tax=Citrus sinensis TaxID=2711 RepID=UPI0003D6E76E|nr:homeobox-leucine zipper protein ANTHOCYANINLESS 2-like isoform X5 [Citrus sinensis]
MSFGSNSVGMGSRVVAEIFPHCHSMASGAIAQFPLSLSIKNAMDAGEMGLIGEQFDPSVVGRIREEEFESRSGSDNVEGASGDDQEANEDGPPRKKKYHRHTPHQIQELESFFKECPHPDEKQRSELSRRLGLESKQIKFWFQNRRTQMKTQMERHENIILRQEHDKLRAENEMLKDAMKNPTCNNCGGPAVPGSVSNYELQQLRIENARLKDELGRICILANKFLGRPLTSSAGPISPQGVNSSLELGVGRNGFGGVANIPGSMMQTSLEFVEGPVMSLTMPHDRNMLIDLALTAMDELIKMAEADSPLWIKSLDGGRDVFNQEEYMRTFSPCIGMKPNGFVTEASRETGMVIINSSALIETMMDAMVAEFQVLSPLVPVRQAKFLRFCKQHIEGVWAVVDVSIDTNREGLSADPFQTYRRLPSGFVVQDVPNNYSKVTWIEHAEYDESIVHHLCRPLLSSGMGFGAPKWVATLQRQCECLAVLMSSTITVQDQSGISPIGRKSMLKLAQRMTYNFCSGVCASSVRKWDKLCVGNVGEDVRVLTRKNVNDPGEPPGVVLCAATTVWLPMTRQRLFDFMRDERMRSEWDILSNGGPLQEMVHIAKGQAPGNCASLLRAGAMNANDSGMLILQETWNDSSGSLVVYAPVDVPSMSMVMNGGDSTCVALLPSGFAILPDGYFGHGGLINSNGTMVKTEGSSNESGGCLLTVGFQILVNSLPTAKLTVESVETVNNLISCTIQKIKAAVLET